MNTVTTPKIAQLSAVKPMVVVSTAREVRLNTEEHRHDRRMLRFGLVGAAIGCMLGIAALLRVPGRDMMYTVIVPFALTYWGLAVGLFLAMGVQHFRMVNGITTEAERVEVESVFSDHDQAKEAIETLLKSGVSPSRVTVFGQDSDELRVATTALHTKRLDKLIVALGSLGFVVGAVWGVLGTPALSASLPSAAMSALIAAFCGAVLGALAGAQIGAVLRVDGMPTTDANITTATVTDGVVAISVQAE